MLREQAPCLFLALFLQSLFLAKRLGFGEPLAGAFRQHGRRRGDSPVASSNNIPAHPGLEHGGEACTPSSAELGEDADGARRPRGHQKNLC